MKATHQQKGQFRIIKNYKDEAQPLLTSPRGMQGQSVEKERLCAKLIQTVQAHQSSSMEAVSRLGLAWLLLEQTH